MGANIYVGIFGKNQAALVAASTSDKLAHKLAHKSSQCTPGRFDRDLASGSCRGHALAATDLDG